MSPVCLRGARRPGVERSNGGLDLVRPRTAPGDSGVEESIVTCARTRGSMMKFLPVAALTASAICVMSASLKLGVIRCACCAEASEALSTTASAHTAKERKTVTKPFSPVRPSAVLLLAAPVTRRLGAGR